MIRSREELIFLLGEASELEHMLACQYLFSAFSLKKDPSEGVTWDQLRLISDWGQALFVLAREEMSHLATVSNLLTSVGSMPHFIRPNFPQMRRYFPFPLQLQRFSKASIKQFICVERPEKIEPADAFCNQMAELARNDDPGPITPSPLAYQTIGDLYAAIQECFETLDQSQLFVGPADAQAGSADLMLMYPDYNIVRSGVFDVKPYPVNDRASAVNAIKAIRLQGEGAISAGEPSHYLRLLKVLKELEEVEVEAAKKRTPFDAARNVVANPALFKHADAPDSTVLLNESTREVADLFNGVYELMLMLLMRFYSHTDETANDLQGLRYTLFPLMTMGVRPLGEILTEMPAFDDRSGQRAGAGFEMYRTAQLLPHKHSAWGVLKERFNNAADRCRELSERPTMPKRLSYVAESLQYTASRFNDFMSG